MFVILVYDVSAGRTQKFLKICRKYLIHVQRSSFEGDLTKSQIKTLLSELRKIVKEGDSVIIYIFRTRKYSERVVLGRQVDTIDNFNLI